MQCDAESNTMPQEYALLQDHGLLGLDGSKGFDSDTLAPFSWNRWFTDAIKPEFVTDEAKNACDAYEAGADPSPLAQAHSNFRLNAQQLNPPSSPVPIPSPSLSKRLFSPLKADSIRTVSSSLISTALGTGVLSIPFAFSLHGLGLGLLTLTLTALASALSLQVLVVSARYTDCQSYAQLLEVAVGSPAASMALDAAILFNGFGGVACLLIFEGDFLPAIFAFFGIHLSRTVAIPVIALLAWPLSLPAQLTALRYVTVLAPCALLLTAGIVFWETPTRYEHMVVDQGEALKVWDFDLLRWLQGVALLFNAFTNHQNAVPAGNALSRPSVERIVKSTVAATFIIWSILIAVGVGGYMSWLGQTKGDFLLNYAEDSKPILFCRILLAISIYFVLPVAAMPTSASMSQLLARLAGGRRQERSGGARPVSATVVMVCCTMIAMAFTDVAKLIGIFGGFVATLIMFWFPAVIYRKVLYPVQPKSMRRVIMTVLVVCGCCGFASAFVNAWMMVTGKQ